MTSDAREKSWEDGQPVEYYDFIRGTTHYRYNTSDRALELNGETYAPDSGLSRENISQGSERNKLSLEVRIPRSNPVADLWHPYPSSIPVGLTVYTGHIGETDALVTWIGRVVSPKYSPTEVTLVCEPSTTLSRKSGQMQCWQRGCMHVLYKQGDGLCNVNRDDFALPATITVYTGNVATATAFGTLADGRLAGGYIEWTTLEGNIERRSISKHVGTAITLFFGTSTIPPGTAVIAYPGCKHNWDDCNGFFNNGVNYGGDLYGPEKSPFNGNPVF